MSAPFDWLNDELAALRAAGLERRRRLVTPLPGGWCEVDGRRLRNFASNDYLDLAHDPRVIAAARSALEESGAGARASALVTGRGPWHARLEQALADFERQPSAVLFPTGYAANIGTIGALAGPHDTIYCDRLNHASLIDACRLSGARLRIHRHDDLERLRRELDKPPTTTGRRWIVTDSVFSMDGDLAPLAELCDLADRYDASIIVDEAHGTGVFGEQGRGVAEATGTEQRVAVRIGTLSKAIGSLGGFVAGPTALVDWLSNRARTQVFSTALPPASCAAATAALTMIDSEPWRRQQLMALNARLRERLGAIGLGAVPGAVGPIVPIVLHEPDRAMHVAAALETTGFLVAGIRPPTVPRGTSRLRITLTCAHTNEDIDALCEGLRIVGSTR